MKRRLIRWEKYYSICRISEFYEDDKWNKAEEEDLIEPRKYMTKNWTKDDEYTYVIWGGTATAPRLYKLISSLYPRAKLMSFIDLYRNIELGGKKSEGIEALDRIKPDTTVFVTTDKANMMALSELGKRKHRKFVIC